MFLKQHDNFIVFEYDVIYLLLGYLLSVIFVYSKNSKKISRFATYQQSSLLGVVKLVVIFIFLLLAPSGYDRQRASYKRETKQQSES